KVVAVGSRKQAGADAFAERFGIPNRHGSYEALVADPEVDIVYVATPHSFHAANAHIAIEAGKHLLIEKAFTITAEQAKGLAAAAHEKGLFVMEAMWTRFLPSMTRIMELIHEGALGTPRVLLADHNQYIPRSKAVRLHDPALGGGALLDLGVYPISFASCIFGRPKAVTARATLTDEGVDELTAVILEYESGAQASLHCGFLAAGPNTASVIGSEGRIEIRAVWYNQTGFTLYDQAGAVVEQYSQEIEGRGMQFQAREVERCIHEGIAESSIMPLSESIEIMETMDEIRRQVGVVYP
ncbi:MAG: Gfo/Idh/MocA family oxidoreductase, partial [Spirochaeta sp.]|nr:Gfo/Idh/MocA family oxidoreductase [Spirochaeta sp.]